LFFRKRFCASGLRGFGLELESELGL